MHWRIYTAAWPPGSVSKGTELFMKLHLIAIGSKMPAWVNAGFAEYQKRLPEHFSLLLHELPMEKRSANTSAQRLKEKEGELILKTLPKRCHVIALDEHGREFNSQELAQKVESLQAAGSDAAIIIGGPDGLSAAVKTRADELWSLSRLTLPHPLVRIVLAETLYRAWSISMNLPYHRA